MSDDEKPLLLVDGSSYLFRAFHALPNLTAADDFPTGALYGVVNMLRKLAKDYAGSPVAVVFDASGKSFRNDIYPEYKANRPRMPDELRCQVEPIHETIKALGMPLLIVPGVEADDVIGTLARQADAAKRRTVISTSDKDMAQLVSQTVTLVNTMSDQTLDRGGVEAKYGVPPERIVDYLALMGDSADNIPGVPKVGPKTAAKWLKTFGSLDAVIARAGEVKGKIGDSLRGALDQLPLSRDLATIRCDVELPVALADLVPQPVDVDALATLFERYDFRVWLAELGVPSAAPEPAVARDYARIDSLATLEDWSARLRAAGTFAFAVHTGPRHYMDADIVGLSFAAEAGKAAYLPLGHDLAGAEQVALADALRVLTPLLEDASIRKVGQDLKFAVNVLANHGIALAGADYDTMLESYVFDSVATRRHSLEDLSAKHLGLQAARYDDLAGRGAKRLEFAAVAVDQAVHYAAERADFALRLHEALWPKLTARGRLQAVYEDIERPLMPVLARVERAGALVDAKRLGEHGRELQERLQTLAEQAYAEAGRPFNLGSPKQLQEVLYDELALPVLQKTQTGQRSTAETALEELAHDHLLPRLILDHRRLAKLKSTYLDALPKQIKQRTGRVHTTYGQAVAATGRLASQDPNLQNIPIRTAEGRRIRAAFVAPEGCKLVAADYSQIELRIMAHLSGDDGLRRAFREGQDVHRATAAEVFGRTPQDVSEDERRSAKTINFGLIYGMSAFGLARELSVPRGVAQGYIDRYFERYPDVRDYMQGIRSEARETGFVETVYGRRLYLPDIRARQVGRRQAAERTAINAPMQGTAADVIKRAMIAVDAWLATAGLPVRMVMQVHDELVFEVAEDAVDALVKGAVERMEAAADLSVGLVVDVGVGDNWDQAH